MPTTTHVSSCTRFLPALILLLAMWPVQSEAEWKIDFSRRMKKTRQNDVLAAQPQKQQGGFFDTLFSPGEPIQEIVILNTKKGFVPDTIRMRKGGRYRIHVVNVNNTEKNVSFILDAFSEHHATYYGDIKTFRLEPRKEGIFSFQSPETSAEGRVIVFNPARARTPASR